MSNNTAFVQGRSVTTWLWKRLHCGSWNYWKLLANQLGLTSQETLIFSSKRDFSSKWRPDSAWLGGGGLAGQLPEGPNYEWRYDVTGIIRRVVLVNSDFRTRKNFSENDTKFGLAPLKMFTSTVKSWKSLKNYILKKRQNISLPGAPEFLRPALRPDRLWDSPSLLCNWYQRPILLG